MYSRKTKLGVFVLEGVNSIACTYFFNYLFFHLQRNFGFTTFHNLLLSAAHGFVYMLSAWQAGRFAQRQGGFKSLRFGFALMTVTMLAGAQVRASEWFFVVLISWTFAVCFTWPAMQAITSEGVSAARLPHVIGLYNVVWAGASAGAYFFGGAVFERFGPASVFYFPAALFATQWAITFWLERGAQATSVLGGLEKERAATTASAEERLRSPVSPSAFLKMAWLANLFAYIAINSAIPLIPELAGKLELSPTFAGFFCSVWFFARTLAFVGLWRWTGWHYRFRWLAGAFATMGICFALILLVPSLWVLIPAQIGFGLSLGLIYYSSLFYAMDVGKTKSEHGGLHEAMIGSGIFAGPALGATTVFFLPAHPNSSTWALSGVLVLGFGGLMWLRFRRSD
ncbi:MAG: MFS transporter [Verrucomicrobia bacterium]|nr:MFS transporter [Verrucomicrobiota bacterium]